MSTSMDFIRICIFFWLTLYPHFCVHKCALFTTETIFSLSLIKRQTINTYGEWRSAPRILNLGTRCRTVVRFTLRPSYGRDESPQRSLCKKLGQVQAILTA
jgi:hypothetical protein